MNKKVKKIEIHIAQIINPISDTVCEFFPAGALVIKANEIQFVGESSIALKKFKNAKIVNHQNNVIIPAFYDMHFHWVQDKVRLMPKDNLLTWLKNYTWPYEASFKDKTLAKKRAKLFQKELIKNGTIGGMIYSSIHDHTVELGLKYFIGHFKIGNVLMDMNSPEYLMRTSDDSKKSVEKLSKKFKEKYISTPRFAITTSPELMKHSAIVAKKNNSFLQTHLSETKEEIKAVLGIYKSISGFGKVKTYTEVYDKVGFLTPNTVLGHGIYLGNKELKIIKKRKSIICHCPTSNAPLSENGLGSGLFPFRKVEKNNITWVLGSDIGGGPYLCMLDVIRSFHLQNKKQKISEATLIKGLYRSTLLPAKVLKIKKAGNLKPGYEANFLVIKNKSIRNFKNAEDVLQTILNSNQITRKNLSDLILKTFYNGKRL